MLVMFWRFASLTVKKTCRTKTWRKPFLCSSSSLSLCIRRTVQDIAHSSEFHRSSLGLSNLPSFEIMLSFGNNIHLSFYLLFLICIASLATSAPSTLHGNHHGPHHSHHLQQSGPFPYGKQADKLLNVNDRNYDASDMIDDFDEDMVRVYPEDHSFASESGSPIASLEPLPINTPPNVGTKKNLLSFTSDMPDIIKKAVVQEWGTALFRSRTKERDQLNTLNSGPISYYYFLTELITRVTHI